MNASEPAPRCTVTAMSLPERYSAARGAFSSYGLPSLNKTVGPIATDARFSSNGNHIQLVRGKKLRPFLQHLLDSEICAALEFQERRVRRERAAEKFGLKLELLQCAFAQALDLPEPVGFGGAVLCAPVVVPEQLVHLCVGPRGRRASRSDGGRRLDSRCRCRRRGTGRRRRLSRKWRAPRRKENVGTAVPRRRIHRAGSGA